MKTFTSTQIRLLQYLVAHAGKRSAKALSVKAEDIGSEPTAYFHDQVDELVDAGYIEEGSVFEGQGFPPSLRIVIHKTVKSEDGSRELKITRQGRRLLKDETNIKIDDTPPSYETEVADKTIEEQISSFYVNSRDFNGIALSNLSKEVSIPLPALRARLFHLVQTGTVTLVSSRTSVNPHIKLGDDLLVEVQIEELVTVEASSIYIYPTPAALHPFADTISHDKPFTARLLQGEPQLQMVYFELAVLDRYSSDPRFTFTFGDFVGFTGISDKYYDDTETLERDKTSIQRFGLGYNSKGERVVVAFLRHLAQLSSDHQRHWNTYLDPVQSECKPDPAFYQSSILGTFPDSQNDYRGFLEEQTKINELAGKIRKRELFRMVYTTEERPREFSFFLRPTLKNFNAFVLLLDHLLSDNINIRFFKGDIQLNPDEAKGEALGTLSLLEMWLRQKLPGADHEKHIVSAIQPMRQVRDIRMRPAHTIQEDKYDLDYSRQQDELIHIAYSALRQLRLLLEEMAGEDADVPELIDNAEENNETDAELPNFSRFPKDEEEREQRVEDLTLMLDHLMRSLFAIYDVRYEAVESNKAIHDLAGGISLANELLQRGEVSLTSNYNVERGYTDKTIRKLAEGNISLLSIVRISIEAQLRWLGAPVPEYDEITGERVVEEEELARRAT